VNFRSWISHLLRVLKIHSASSEHGDTQETCWNEKVKRLQELALIMQRNPSAGHPEKLPEIQEIPSPNLALERHMANFRDYTA
jgi:hypothetical protein